MNRTWEAAGWRRIQVFINPVIGAVLLVGGSTAAIAGGAPVWFALVWIVGAVVIVGLILRMNWWLLAWKVELTETELRLYGPRRSWTFALSELTKMGRAISMYQFYVATANERVYLAPHMRDGMQLMVELSRRRPELSVTDV